MTVKLALDKPLLKEGIKHYHVWDYQRLPHMIVFGSTGSGKTFFSKLLLARISKHIPDCQITLCNFKGDDDFKFCSDTDRHFEFTSCTEGLERFYSAFQARQGKDNNRDFRLLFFDEWASYLNYLDKKSAEAAKAKLATAGHLMSMYL